MLPAPLLSLARVSGEQRVDVEAPVTVARVLDVLEARHPVLRGTIRGHNGGKRRAYIRYFACARDISHDPDDAPLPDAVIEGTEPLLVVGAISGG
jgi:hypothetical protein